MSSDRAKIDFYFLKKSLKNKRGLQKRNSGLVIKAGLVPKCGESNRHADRVTSSKF